MIAINAPSTVPLSVPFSEKDKAKSFGARWNGGNRSWVIPVGVNMVPFIEWMTEPMLGQLRKTLADNGFENKPEDQAITLFQLMNSVKGVINDTLKEAYWIKAEVLHCQNNNHMYLELSDYGQDRNASAKGRAMIWADNLGLVTNFEEKTGMTLQAGLKILVKVTVDFHPQFGLSLMVKEIDPTFTLGDMESKIREIRTKLQADGIYNLNRDMTLPTDFTKVAVIAPANAAGLGDFKTQSDVLHQRGLCLFDFYSASFQGAQAEQTIKAAFTSIAKKGNEYDAIVMIRGGGDKAGLYELNTELLASLVCQSKIPVIVGIGHERDTTLLDELACLRCPTPSMVIGHIVGTVIENVQAARANMKSIKQNMTNVIHQSRLETKNMMTEIKHDAQTIIHNAKQANERLITQTKNNHSNTLKTARSTIKLLMKDIMLQNPKNVLDHGYAIVRHNNTVITSAKSAADYENLTIQFKDGQIKH
jgi:exodeoxyribonuclease VII large subunit